MQRLGFVAWLCLAAFLATATADVVHLKGGGRIDGEVVEETDSKVTVAVGRAEVSFDRSEVERIERTPRSVAIKAGAHFRVTCHFADESCAEQALLAAEAAWAATVELLGATPAPPANRFEIHVYRRTAEYEAAEAKWTGGRYRNHDGFSDRESHSGHVLVRPDYDDAVWRRVGPPKRVLGLVAHEASHLTMFACVTNSRQKPEWLSEGVPLHVERQVLVEQGWSSGPPSDVRTCADMECCARLLRQGRLPEPRAIFQGHVAQLGLVEQYALHWAFFELLLRADQKDRTRELLKEMLGADAEEDLGPRLRTSAERLWGGKGLDDLNDAFRASVDAFPPLWRVEGVMEAWGDTCLHWAPRHESNRLWRSVPLGCGERRITGSVEFLAGEDRSAEIDLGLNDAGFVAVVFNPELGVRVSEYRYADKAWHRLVPWTGKPAVGAKTNFEVRVADAVVDVKIDGKDVLSAHIGDRDVSGTWGLAVYHKTAVLWTGVTVR